MTQADAVAESPKKPPKFIRAVKALRDRKMAAMLALAVAAGIPYGAVLGTLSAWLTDGGVKASTIGAFSIITLAYAFKFLWSPMFQQANFPLPQSLGPRRAWLLAFQIPITLMLFVLAVSNPVANIGWVALLALFTAILSAMHDIVLDAWRIEIADTDEDRDLMSALYQFGYRSASLITGFAALIFAAKIGWQNSYLILAGVMALAVVCSLIAPEPSKQVSQDERPSFLPNISKSVGQWSARGVTLGWAIAAFLIISFVAQALTVDPPPSGRAFVLIQGPIIIGLSILFPALLAAALIPNWSKSASKIPEREPKTLDRIFSSLFRGILDPLMEMIQRLRWGVLLVLGLALTYRFTDAVWGGFAYPFYLGTESGALGHSLEDVAVASKFFGVLMTLAGVSLGVAAISAFGRMSCLIFGAFIAAVTNLLYADLAAGGAGTQAFLDFTYLSIVLENMAFWSHNLLGSEIAAEDGPKMARLMIVIAGENLAGGFASVAVVVYLSSVVSKKFAAVQYALLASLSMLIGTLGRPLLGDIIDQSGFYDVFILTFWLGMIAVVLSAAEAWRQSRIKPEASAEAEPT